MKIGRFIKSSLSEWKGKNSCIIEVRGSEIRCPYLSSPDLFEEEGPCIDESEILDYIGTKLDTIEAVTIGGGEPLLQKDLYPFLKKLKKFKLPILLETDGSCPEVLDDLAGARMFDRVRLRIPSEFKNGIPAHISDSLKILERSDIDFEVVMVAVPGIINIDTVSLVSKSLKAKGILAIKRFESEKSNDPEFSKLKPLKRKEILDLVASAKKFTKKVEIRGF